MDRASLPAELRTQLEELDFFPERSERLEALIGFAEEFVNPTPEELPRTAACRVPGCESEVFARVEFEPGARLRIAVDNPQGISAMALAVILQKGLTGTTPGQLAAVPEDVVYEVFGRELSMGKSLGLTGMVRALRAEAQRAAAA